MPKFRILKVSCKGIHKADQHAIVTIQESQPEKEAFYKTAQRAEIQFQDACFFTLQEHFPGRKRGKLVELSNMAFDGVVGIMKDISLECTRFASFGQDE